MEQALVEHSVYPEGPAKTRSQTKKPLARLYNASLFQTRLIESRESADQSELQASYQKTLATCDEIAQIMHRICVISADADKDPDIADIRLEKVHDLALAILDRLNTI